MVKTKKEINPFEIVLFVILSVYSLILISLFVWAIFASFMKVETFKENPLAFFKDFEIKNYIDMFSEESGIALVYKDRTGETVYGYFSQLINSLIYAGGGGIFQTFAVAAVAYCTSRYKGIVSSIINMIVIVTMILPIVGTLPSLLDLMKDMGVHDTWIGVFMQRFGFCNAYYLIFYAGFSSLSWEYAESAFIDGASHFTVFVRIMLPLVKTLLVTVFILFFVQYWNDYQTPWMLLPSIPTAARGLYHYLYDKTDLHRDAVPKQIAAGVVLFVPIFIIFVVFRDKIMGNLTEGGIKG